MSISPPVDDSVVVQPVIVTMVTRSLPLFVECTVFVLLSFIAFDPVCDALPPISTDFSIVTLARNVS